MFTLDHDPVDGSHLIVAGGELDLAATSEMSAIFAMSAAGPQYAVVLDLVGVDFIDSSALGTILRAAQQLETTGKRLHVVVPDGPVRRLLEITGTASRFTLHETRDAAFARGLDERVEIRQHRVRERERLGRRREVRVGDRDHAQPGGVRGLDAVLGVLDRVALGIPSRRRASR